MAFGIAVFIGAWRMDRLENLHINKYEVPGTVPGILGAAVALLGRCSRCARCGAARCNPRAPLRRDRRAAASTWGSCSARCSPMRWCWSGTASRSGWRPSPSWPASSSSSTVSGNRRWAAARASRSCWPWSTARAPVPS
ncbi:hypothetical protein HK414_09450 [Ramlibacter terrae]|uniref:Uncharacterized protein n=1 Tax=Ramlibacter terrae TaxID=2732511 RepID=A0ABX6P4Y6_9BURK|nr:hypothetical protein HK414_09450 [Ramlibacter terrae]